MVKALELCSLFQVGLCTYMHPYQRVITNEWLYVPLIASRISDHLHRIRGVIIDNEIPIYPQSDLVLELTFDESDREWKCGYYFAHHPKRYIYWIEELELQYQSKYFGDDVRGSTTSSQAGKCFHMCLVLFLSDLTFSGKAFAWS
jgi:hypothetical protein